MLTAVRIARTGLAVVLLLVAAWLFLPTQLGGTTTYVATHGDSMAPRFDTGDLALLRPAGDYGVGDVVAYESADLDTVVMHRIVARDGDRFVLQGDSNSWVDSDRPGAEQILGRLWLRIPHGGQAIAVLRSPSLLLLIGSAVTIVLWTTRRPRGRHTSGTRAARRPGRRSALSTPARARARQAASASAVVALLAAGGTAALFLLPDTQVSTDTAQVTQQGRYAYSGTAVAGTTYPTGAVSTGDPVFTQLSGGLTVSLEDTVTGATDVAGTVRLDVSLATADGWSTALPSGAPAAVRDGAATASVRLDPTAAAEVLRRHFAEVGGAGASATLTVTPAVDLTGTVRGRSFTAAALPGLTFTLDATALRLSGGAEVLSPVAATPVAVDRVVPRTLGLAGLDVPIGTARIAVAALFAAALVTALATARMASGRAADPADELPLRSAARLLPVSALTPRATVIDVADAQALSRVAERLDGLVLHVAGPHEDTFAVQDGETTFRYVARRAGEAPTPPAVPAATVLRRLA